jgi:chemotaxis protein CheX
VILEYTGIVGITGNKKGCIYLTTSGDMLRELAQMIIDTVEISNEEIKDLVGEIANTIAGNVREAYGSDFMVSVPVIIEGITKDLKLPEDITSFVIPLNWAAHTSYLVVCLE